MAEGSAHKGLKWPEGGFRPAVVVYRGDHPESVHRASIAVVDPEGRLVRAFGDPGAMVFLRSAAKPFQAMALVESGAFEAFGLSLEELAVVCGSHGGEDFHADAVLSILSKCGLGEDRLRCGVVPPLHRPTASRMAKEGKSPTPSRNPCSGKHAGMLCVCRHLGFEVEGYERSSHPVQRMSLRIVSEVTDHPEEEVWTALDGCGVPVFGVPLRKMALAYARLARPESSPRHEGSLKLVRRAMLENPLMVAGSGRFTTRLIEVSGKTLVAKDGAEGVFGVGHLPSGLGLAVKVEDGSDRALSAVVLKALSELELLPPEAIEDLGSLLKPPVKTASGEVAGRIEALDLFG